MRQIEIIPDAVPLALCDALMRLHDHALLHGGSRRVEETWRRCTIVDFPSQALGSTELYEATRNALAPHFGAYKKKHGAGTLHFCTLFEKPEIISYDPLGLEKEHFHQHADAWSVESATRAVSVILFLNDVAEGGETVFPEHDIAVRPRARKLLLFPSAFTHTHLARPPTSEKKYVVVSWLHFGGTGHHYAVLPL